MEEYVELKLQLADPNPNISGTSNPNSPYYKRDVELNAELFEWTFTRVEAPRQQKVSQMLTNNPSNPSSPGNPSNPVALIYIYISCLSPVLCVACGYIYIRSMSSCSMSGHVST